MLQNKEDRLVSELTGIWGATAGTLLGPGDDCAVWEAVPGGQVAVSKVDAVVEGVHFSSGDAAAKVGHKALGRALSDFGAMGAVPKYALIAVGFPFESRPPSWIKASYRGMGKLAAKYRVGLAGGELTRSSDIWIAVSLHGYGKRKLLAERRGGNAGDLLFVTGRLGGSFPVRHLAFCPRVREGLWLSRFGVSAMLDISDGLGRDLPRLAQSSDCSFCLEPERVPRHRGCSPDEAVNDGEDYELLFSISPRKAKRLEKSWPFPLPLTCIGELLPKRMNPVTGGLALAGWDHLG